nr:hypothetical protein [Micromonospora chalcea]
MNCGCSDGGFEYFRGWLHKQGRETASSSSNANPCTASYGTRTGRNRGMDLPDTVTGRGTRSSVRGGTLRTTARSVGVC